MPGNLKDLDVLLNYFIVASPFIFVAIPSTFFEHGPTICPYKLLTGNNCPGCGMTRAFSNTFRLDLESAWEYNRLIVVVFPLYLILVYKSFLKIKKSISHSNTKRFSENRLPI